MSDARVRPRWNSLIAHPNPLGASGGTACCRSARRLHDRVQQVASPPPWHPPRRARRELLRPRDRTPPLPQRAPPLADCQATSRRTPRRRPRRSTRPSKSPRAPRWRPTGTRPGLRLHPHAVRRAAASRSPPASIPAAHTAAESAAMRSAMIAKPVLTGSGRLQFVRAAAHCRRHYRRDLVGRYAATLGVCMPRPATWPPEPGETSARIPPRDPRLCGLSWPEWPNRGARNADADRPASIGGRVCAIVIGRPRNRHGARHPPRVDRRTRGI